MSQRPVTPSGETRVACVVGDPIAHSLSPAIHNAAFRALGLDWIYTAFRTADGAGSVDAMRVLHISGMSVTMPCKEEAAAVCDELSPTAAALGSANALVLRDDGSVFGNSTDGQGLLAALAEDSVDVSGKAVLVLGAGGAARAAARALQHAGGQVRVAARRPDAAERAVGGDAATVAWTELEPAVASCDVVVNATPIGMRGERPPFRAEALHAGQVVVDLVYEPSHTPLLAAASEAGARTVNGLGMLVHQAAVAFELWTGEAAPLPEMQAAVAAGG